MSPRARESPRPPPCFPRVSGDEPVKPYYDYPWDWFSPRERG